MMIDALFNFFLFSNNYFVSSLSNFHQFVLSSVTISTLYHNHYCIFNHQYYIMEEKIIMLYIVPWSMAPLGYIICIAANWSAGPRLSPQKQLVFDVGPYAPERVTVTHWCTYSLSFGTSVFQHNYREGDKRSTGLVIPTFLDFRVTQLPWWGWGLHCGNKSVSAHKYMCTQCICVLLISHKNAHLVVYQTHFRINSVDLLMIQAYKLWCIGS